MAIGRPRTPNSPKSLSNKAVHTKLPMSNLPVAKAISLRIKNQLSWDQIAKQLNCPMSSIHQACRPYLDLLDDPQALKGYQENKADLIEAAELKMLASLSDPESIKKAGLAARSLAFGLLYDKGRLEKGLSTQNVTTVHAELGSLQVDREALESSLASIEAEIALLKGQSAQPQAGPFLELPGPDDGKAE